MLFLVFTSQTFASATMLCEMPGNSTHPHSAAMAEMNELPHGMMDMSEQPHSQHQSHHNQTLCADCECSMGSCSLVIPAETLSCAPPRPDKNQPEYSDFPVLEQISLLYRPPISR